VHDSRTRRLTPFGWLALLAGAAVLAVALFQSDAPDLAAGWEIDRGDAEAIARAELPALGEMPEDAYVVVVLDEEARTEFRALEMTEDERRRFSASRLGQEILAWRVTVYPPGVRPNEWLYQATVSRRGDVLGLRLRLPRDEAGGRIDPDRARERAAEFLAERGIDLGAYEAPEVKTQDRLARTDTTVRFASRERLLGARIPYGVEVEFAGERLAGFQSWTEDPDDAELDALIQPFTLLGNLRFLTLFIVLPLVGVVFIRKYHEGVVGVDRSVRIVGLCLAVALGFVILVARPSTQGWNIGTLSREQMTFIWGVQMLAIYFLPQALVAALGWSVGESLCRERWGRKLAAFDALFRRDWSNRTVALSALRGLALGATLAAILLALPAVAPSLFGRLAVSFHFGPWWQNAAFPGLAMLGFLLLFTLYVELFGRLFLVPWLVRRLGVWGGGTVAAVLTAAIFWGPVGLVPIQATMLAGLVFSSFVVFTFLRWDFLTSSLASITAQGLVAALPYLLADSRSIQLSGWIVLLGVALPSLLSLRWLGSDREFVYRYDEIPPHVRRIAERERQRVELETARNIQSSILPELPAQLHGVEIAHTYLPATEVGGDFYDVLALEDGRLAFAVGDVAGHGVSSGLVMSMAKSALAVQVTFDPRVEPVFGTLNRMVYQSARKRLLATLCYALLDPERRELQFASAGHLFPYRVSADGRVESLESIAYPLGVRATLDVTSRLVRLDPGDTIFLSSDGLVEARREGSEEHFGFERVERVLAESAGSGAAGMRDRMLGALAEFTDESPREDDLTLLVLRLPA